MTPKAKQIDLGGKEVPSILVDRETVTKIKFESPKVKLTIREDKLAESMSSPEATLKMVQTKMRIVADDPLDAGEFDEQVREMIAQVRGYHPESQL